jgi:hypothetical protein
VKLSFAVKQEVANVQNKLTVAFNFYQKFTTIVDKVGLRDRFVNSVVTDDIKKVAWLLFILAKIKILKRREDIVDSAYLLCAIIHQVLMHLPREVNCDFIENFKKTGEYR